ncbi:MAG: RNA methyltransferase [Desulfurococcaceae archaeon]
MYMMDMKTREPLENAKFKVYFVLRGGNEYLSRGELNALIETYMYDTLLKCFTMTCISSINSKEALKIAQRAAFIKEAGLLKTIQHVDAIDIETLMKELESKIVHLSIQKSTISKELAKSILRKLSVVTGSQGIGESRIIFTDGYLILGKKIYVKKQEKTTWINMNKPFRRSIEITPDIARVLINLTRVKEGDLLIDPFAGTGSILLEAWSMGIRGVGVDIDWAIAEGMARNIRFANTNSITVLGDSRFIVYREVDHVATDLPYGKGASTYGVEIRSLYEDFMSRLSEYLSRNGYACFMIPIWLEEHVDEVISRYGFYLIERYYDYVHGSLIRVINVVRKW